MTRLSGLVALSTYLRRTRPFENHGLRVAALFGCLLANAPGLHAQTLPAPWTAQDVGSPALAGQATYASGAFSVSGAGVDIWDSNDQFQFVYQQLSGDGQIVARITSLLNTDPWAKAGVMIRQDLTDSAPNALAEVTNTNSWMTFQQRVTAAGSSTSTNFFPMAGAHWVRLVRSGNVFTGYRSANGTAWTLMGSQTIPMPTNVYVGLAVTSHNPSAVAVGTFSNVTVTGGSASPPSLTSLTPTAGAVGTSVTIAGTNFGGTQGTSTVTFNGTAATPTSWSGTSLVAPVPGGATTGNVVVTVGGQASNAVPFTVSSPPPPPSLTNLTPGTGTAGTAVTMAGANFGATQGASIVTFNGMATTPTSWSGTSVVAPVPNGATTGAVVVTVGGQGSNAVSFTVTAPPSLTSLAPAAGAVGTAVTLTGTNFGGTRGTSTVTFNGTAATPTSWSATSLVAPVPSGATTGNVVVTVGGQTSNGVSFTVSLPPPTLTSLTPTAGAVGTAVTIAGTNFGGTRGTSTVTFNGTAATSTSWSATSLVAPVPAGATTGSVVVTVGGQASNGVSFTVSPPPPPSLTSLTPTAGAVGTAVTIAGTNFGGTRGTSTVTFNGTAATPTSWSATSLVAPVPSGATTGNVVVTVGGQASNGVSFTVNPTAGLPAPWIAQDVGGPAVAGQTTYASGAFSVSGAGVDIWDNNDQFQFVYQPLNGDGQIVARVTSLLNTDQWAKAGVMIRQDLTDSAPNALAEVTNTNWMTFQQRVTAGASSISTNFFTSAAPYWVRLVRSGNVFTGYYSTTGTAWTLMGSQTVPMATNVYVGLAVTSHNPSVALVGTFSSVTVTAGSASPPSLTSLTPSAGAVGTAVTMAGTNFGGTQGTSSVTFNGMAATPTSWSGTSLVAPVPNGATTGSIVVTVGGVASNGMSFTVTASVPTLTSLNPTSGAVGTSVTMTGTNFGGTRGTSTVTFNGTAATPTSWSATSLVAPVPSGATTGSVVVTVGGQASNGIPFTVTVIQPGAVTATWNANAELDVAGYVVYYGTQTGVYSTSVDVGNVTTWQGSFMPGARYYFAIRAYNTNLQFSPYSAEAFVDVAAGLGLTQSVHLTSSPRVTVSPSPVKSQGLATATIIDPSLAAFWPLNDGVGRTAFDASGRGMNGTLVNGPVWTTGRVGGAIGFDGLTNHVTTNFVENLTAWTVAVWVRSPSAPSSASRSGPVQREKNFQINWNHTDAAFRGAVALRAGGTWHAASFGALAANTWYHLVGTYDGDTLRAYVDGVLATANPVPSGNPDLETLPLELGARAGVPSYFAGSVHGVRIYGRAISAAEAAVLAQPDPTPPTAVTLSATPTGQGVSLSWTAAADPSSGASIYRIYRGTTAGGTKSPLAEGLGTALRYQDRGTASFTIYYYEVRAVTGNGVEGLGSNEAVVVTGR